MHCGNRCQADCFAALNLSGRYERFLLITKSDLESSDSFLAQGGICVLRDNQDYDSYFEDTMRAGHYENRKESVDIMIRSSQEVIRDLIGYGVEFQTQKDRQRFIRLQEKEHIPDHVFLFHEDITGKEITSKVISIR